MTTDEIIRYFTSADGFLRAAERTAVEGQEGVYACYSDLSLLDETSQRFPASAPWRLRDHLLLYVGTVTKRMIKKRLYYHFGGGRADQSPFQRRLGCLIAKKLGLQLVRGEGPGFLTFDPPHSLRRWISDHVSCKVAVTEQAEDRERAVLQKLMPPLNVKGLPEPTPFHLAVRQLEKTLRKQAVTPPAPERRSPQGQAEDERIASEPQLAPLALPPSAALLPVEAHIARPRRPLAVEGIVENGMIRLLDPSVKLPERSRVIIVAADGAPSAVP
jgi:hypothetical protein